MNHSITQKIAQIIQKKEKGIPREVVVSVTVDDQDDKCLLVMEFFQDYNFMGKVEFNGESGKIVALLQRIADAITEANSIVSKTIAGF
jgi:hypothetical protein